MLWRLTGLAVAIYVVVNVILVFAATVVTTLRIEFTVVDAKTDAPIPNASVVWGAESGDFTVVATSDASGRFEDERPVGFDPIWMFPKIGSVRFVEYEARVMADGYTDRKLSLRDEVSGWTVGDAEVTLRVAMTPTD